MEPSELGLRVPPGAAPVAVGDAKDGGELDAGGEGDVATNEVAVGVADFLFELQASIPTAIHTMVAKTSIDLIYNSLPLH